METLGKEIKIARIRKGVQQQELCAIVGISRAQLSAIETDKAPGIGFWKIVRIARALGLRLDGFVDEPEALAGGTARRGENGSENF